ncbi:MAG: family 43 glycosylhydrolase [Sedimentisphaerales bacterium]|nr:family 43 glycosylhydrolase [Sedimentisphaerales bacterium]
MKRAVLLTVLSAIACDICLGGIDTQVIEKGLESHDRALHIKDGWIRDPYIVLAPDGYYYLTGTTPLPQDERQVSDRYNTGLGPQSIVGYKMQLWPSQDLMHWEYLGTPYSLLDGIWYQAQPERFEQTEQAQWRLWAPELHPIDGRWVIVHTSPSPVPGANLSVTDGAVLQGPFANPLGVAIGRRHDPSLFVDDDGSIWIIWGATQIAPLRPDLSGLAGEATRIGPANRNMGHEGCLIRKIGGKYVLFGTGWSTDKMRRGTYNLYYCTSEKITGPYGPRQFAGRFLGHGTPLQDQEGRWWCTAFFNADVPPLARAELATRDMSDNAYTINGQGVTIVPLDVKVRPDGSIHIRAKDPDYARPGPEEAQSFELTAD